ncbi:hypothetical protein QOT17_006005 [Balamuthia mandrillaris]
MEAKNGAQHQVLIKEETTKQEDGSSVHWETTESLVQSTFWACMPQSKTFPLGSYANIVPPCSLLHDAKTKKTTLSVHYRVFNPQGFQRQAMRKAHDVKDEKGWRDADADADADANANANANANTLACNHA